MIFDVSHAFKPSLSHPFVKLISVKQKQLGGWDTFKIYVNTERLATLSRLKNCLKYCRSHDMTHDCCASIFTRHNYVKNQPFVMCTLLLRYMSNVLT